MKEEYWTLVQAGVICVEEANPCHGYEWKEFRDGRDPRAWS
jgi:hypothetical protein